MLNVTKEKKKCQNSKIWKIYNSLSNFGRDAPQEYAWFLEWIWYELSEEMSFQIFTSIWSYVNENENKS